MSLPRFFIEGQHALGEIVSLEGGDARKIALVLRLKEGDEIEAIDSGAAASRLDELIAFSREPAAV